MNDASSPRHETSSRVYVPVIAPVTTRRERTLLHVFSWTFAIAFHIAAFFVAGGIIDYIQASFDIEMNWSNDPLTGFGMMGVAPEDDEMAEVEPPPPVEMDEDPFAQNEADMAQPELDPTSIVEPSEEEEDVDTSKPIYDLSRDKKKLASVRADVASMPNLHVLAPGNARLIVLIRNDRVAGSRFENSVRRLFRAFPDYRFTLGASDIDPIRDIQALLIATANPKLYAETFLVVAHKIPPDTLKKNITQSFPTRLVWKKHHNRPLGVPDSGDGKYSPNSGIYKRSIYLPDDQTVLFLKPEVLPSLDVAHVDAVVKTRDADLQNNQAATQTFLQSLGGIAQSDSVSVPTLFFMVQGIEGIYLGRGFPEFTPPSFIMASMSTADQPHVNLEATFKSEKDAKDFVALWPDIVSAASGMGIPGVGAILNALALTPEKNTILVSGDLNGAMISLVLMFAVNYLERNS